MRRSPHPGDGEQPAFPHGNRWKVGDENIAHDSARQSGDEPEGDDADQIEVSRMASQAPDSAKTKTPR